MVRRPRLDDERGATAIEYGMIIALVTIVMVVGLQQVGGNTNSMYNRITNSITTATR